MTLPIITESNSMPVVPGAEAFGDNMFAGAFTGFETSHRYLRAKKLDFRVSSGQGETILANGEVVGVLLGVAPFNHCSWYARKYQEGQEPKAPDLLWIQRDPNDFPDDLPAQFRQKQNVGGVARWDFRIARRTVWALINRDATGQMSLDIDNPVIFDMTSASMYGRSYPQNNAYKWSGLRGFCEQYSTAAGRVNPSMFPMQILIDPNSPVQGVVVFRPFVSNNGAPAFLDNDTYARVVEMAQSQLVADMVTVQERRVLEDGTAAAVTPVTPVQTVTTPSVTPVPPVQTAAPAAPVPPVAPQPVVTPVQPSESLLEQAQNIINQATAQPDPMATAQHAAPVAPPVPPVSSQTAAPAAPTHQPVQSTAAAAGIQSIMGSLNDL